MSDVNDDDYKHALNFETFEDCWTEPPKTWLVEGVVALDEDSSWVGPPASLKSALLTDLAVHIAAGRDWRGYKFNRCCNDPDDVNFEERRGVLIFALERAPLTRRRLAAYASRDGLGALPIGVVDNMIDLLDPACIKIISDTISKFEMEKNCIVGMLLFDTWSKAIAAGKENDSETQNLALLHLKKSREASYGRFHIATIGHNGKNLAAGERGSNAKLGGVDLVVQIAGDKVRTATIVKANDQPEDVLASFEMEEVTVIRRLSDGTPAEPYTVGILAAATPAREARTGASRPQTGKHAQVLDALTRAIAARGQDGAVHADYWKEELTRAGLLNPNAKNPWEPFRRIRKSIAQHIIEEHDNLVRIITPLTPLKGCVR